MNRGLGGDVVCCNYRCNMEPRLSQHISEKMHDIIRRFVSRTERFKERAIQPPTPSTGEHTSGLLLSYEYTLFIPENGSPTATNVVVVVVVVVVGVPVVIRFKIPKTFRFSNDRI